MRGSKYIVLIGPPSVGVKYIQSALLGEFPTTISTIDIVVDEFGSEDEMAKSILDAITLGSDRGMRCCSISSHWTPSTMTWLTDIIERDESVFLILDAQERTCARRFQEKFPDGNLDTFSKSYRAFEKDLDQIRQILMDGSEVRHINADRPLAREVIPEVINFAWKCWPPTRSSEHDLPLSLVTGAALAYR